MVMIHKLNIDPEVPFAIGKYDEAVPMERDRRRREYDAARNRALRHPKGEEGSTVVFASDPSAIAATSGEAVPPQNTTGERREARTARRVVTA